MQYALETYTLVVYSDGEICFVSKMPNTRYDIRNKSHSKNYWNWCINNQLKVTILFSKYLPLNDSIIWLVLQFCMTITINRKRIRFRPGVLADRGRVPAVLYTDFYLCQLCNSRTITYTVEIISFGCIIKILLGEISFRYSFS